MTEKTICTWESIANALPTKPSVRTLQRKWRKLRLPIRTDKITGKKFAYAHELLDWILKNPKKV